MTMLPQFRPHPLVRGGQIQTISGLLFTTPVPTQSLRRILTLEGGDRTSMLVDEPQISKACRNVILFHGLGGSADSSYCQRLAAKLVHQGYRVFRFNHRGAGAGEVHLSKGVYHCGSIEDMLTALRWVAERFPKEPISVVGFSLSGTILLNVLSEAAESVKSIGAIDSALAICCPMDLEASSVALTNIKVKHIDRYYTWMLQRMANDRATIHRSMKHPKLPNRMTLREFDKIYTAPVAGFDSREHYYRTCSPYNKLSSVRLPTMVLQTRSDPVVPLYSIPLRCQNKNITIRLESCGGHMGFIGAKKTRWQDHRWLDEFIYQWLEKTPSFSL